MKTMFKLALTAAVMTAAAGSANAADILHVTSVQAAYTGALPHADIHNSAPSLFVNNAPITPLKVTGSLNGGSAVEIFAYCVDIFQGIGAGNFQVVSLLDYLNGNSAKYKMISAIIGAEGGSLGNLLGKGHDAAVQTALWEVVNETSGAFNVTANSFFVDDASTASLTTDANGFLAAAAGKQAKPLLNLYVAKSASKQDMLYWTYSAPVPEPATWAMMMLGMGAVGASMRGARRQAVVRFA